MKPSRTERIGILGGTFDPIHIGHLLLSEFIKDELELDYVLFLPARIHPLKENAGITAAHHRLEMVRLAIEDNTSFMVSDIELRRETVSYTIDTLISLRKQYPREMAELFYFIGMDNINQFHLWKDPERILQLCQLVVFERPGVKLTSRGKSYLQQAMQVKTPLIEISSTDIRKRVRKGKSIRYYVPSAVEAYIYTHRLYLDDPHSSTPT